MKYLIHFIAILMCLLCFNKGFATHIVGGELYYDHLGGNQYKITLKVYRDCLNGQVGFDTPASVGVFDANGILIKAINMTNPVITKIPVEVNNPCLQVPPVICTEEGIYTEIVTLSPGVGGLDLVYQRCCRNNIIENIISPESTGSTYIAHVPDPALFATNSSPHYNNLPPLVLCNGEPFVFDHSATDPDGDVLVYEFCTPFHGASSIDPMPQPPNSPPYTNINWSAGYNQNTQILGSPNLQINGTTGQLTCTPTTNGIYVVGICVKEYRNGELISSTLRDYQFTVVTCTASIISAVADQSILCDGYTMVFDNQSTNADFFHWDFGVPGTLGDTSIEVSPTYTYPDTGLYEVTLIANPGWPCADTSVAEYWVQYPITGEIYPVENQCFDGNNFDFDISGNFTSGATVLWNFPNSSIPNSTTFSPTDISFLSPGTQLVTATIDDRNCTRNFALTLTVYEEPLANVGDILNCNGLSVNPVNTSSGSSGFFWDFGDLSTSGDTSLLSSPSYTYSQSGVYQVTLIADNNKTCFDTTFAVFDVRGPMDLGYSTISPQCIEGHSFDFTLSGNYSNNATIDWNFGNGSSPTSSQQENPQGITYDTSGVYIVSVDLEDNGCFHNYSDTIDIYMSPVFNPIIITDTGCAPLTVNFTDGSIFQGEAAYFWNFGDGVTSTYHSPTHTYENPGTYTVSYTLNTLEGCLSNFQQTFTDAILVHPKPTAAFSLKEPDLLGRTSIWDHSSSDVIANYFYLEDTVITDPAFDYSFDGFGMINIMEIVSNEFQCLDTAYYTVEVVPETLLFIPNAFTPNGDGNNEYFQPVTYGIPHYQFMIFDRWGQLIYQGNEASHGWDGRLHGVLVQNDVYVWKIEYQDYEGLDYSKIGHVSIIR